MLITRKKAVCMYFSQECTDENYVKFSKKIEDFGADVGGMDICHLDDPRKPVLVSLVRILADPFSYKRYLESTPRISCQSLEQKPDLSTELQVLKFINYVFLPEIEATESAYEEKLVNIKDVFNTVNSYTDTMIDKSVQSFTSWCKIKKALFLNAPVSRKRKKVLDIETSIRLRNVFVLKNEYLDNVAKSIISYIPEYRSHIRNLKEEGYCIIGYARKSKGKEEKEVRLRLLQKMVDSLKNRSLVDQVFTSICSSASSLISSRDLQCDKSIEKLEKVNGNTQDLLKFLETTQKNVCLVVIDFTGLSTNTDDLKNFVSNHKKLKKIIIDKLPFENKTESITREMILENSSVVNLFNCRTNSNQRSKQI